jgi:hypothetical protein
MLMSEGAWVTLTYYDGAITFDRILSLWGWNVIGKTEAEASPPSIAAKICSWSVVGTVVTLLLGAGVNFTASLQPWIADCFYLVGCASLLAKFVT